MAPCLISPPAPVARSACHDAGGVPFDWRLAVAGGRSWLGTDYGDGSTAPVALEPELLTMYAMELEDSLVTAVVISLFSDRRAGVDDVLPLNVTDRRGWVGEEFVGQAATGDDTDAWGSLLWLLLVSKATVDVLERARFAAEQSLRWMVRDGIADRVVVTAEWEGGGRGQTAWLCGRRFTSRIRQARCMTCCGAPACGAGRRGRDGGTLEH